MPRIGVVRNYIKRPQTLKLMIREFMSGRGRLNRFDFRSKRIWLAVGLIGVIVISGIAVYYLNPKPLANVRVSIFYDNGVQIQSKIAAEHMFEWMGAQVTTINKTDLLNGVLESTDLLLMPGGLWTDERCTIVGENEMNLVRQYVLSGGAYFGIEGGATYATNFRTGLFDGELYPDVFGAGYYLTEIDINRESLGPDLAGEPETYSLLYEQSGYFDIAGMSEIIPIASYHNTSYYCMIAFQANDGRVFLTSPHPEYEEGSMVDGTDYFDRLNDPDSEWQFMLKIAQWLLNL